MEQQEVRYVLNDEEGEPIRVLPYQFPHSEQEKRWKVIIDLSTIDDAPF